MSPIVQPRQRLVPAGRLAGSRLALTRAVGAFGRTLGTDDPAVAASLFGQAWAVSVTRAAIASLVLERRVPDLSAASSELVLDGAGRPSGVRPVTGHFAALAGDPASGHPSAEAVAGIGALFAWARLRIFDRHLAGVVDGLHRIAPVGRRLLWGNVAAAAGGGFAALSAAGVDPERLLADAAELLDAPGAPTSGLARLFPVEHAGSTRLFVKRDTCCLLYRLPDGPATCVSCRLLDDDERRRRITLRLAEPG